MPYDASKDQVIETWENEETGLIISVNRYGTGEPKMQIGPRSFTKKDGSRSMRKPGRLSIDDVIWLSEVIEEVKETMNEAFLDEA